MKKYDVVVIGGGPAGLSAAESAAKNGAKTAIIEREARPGGILKQCVHDGFGLIRFGEKLSGPEYAERYMEAVAALPIDISTLAFVTKIEKNGESYIIRTVTRGGIEKLETSAIILATGCRERTAKQVFIQGTRPSGVFTAGTAQNFVNLQGKMPAKRCVILGSGDIGLIMARRLTLEGAEVEGVYEVKSTPSGLTRNIHQCLDDFKISLYLSHTVTRVFGADRLEGVEVAEVDSKMKPVKNTERRIDCDALILSVGLIPENEIAETLGVKISQNTKGPVIDQNYMTALDGVYSCGNAMQVHDLVDYVSEGAAIAGASAAQYAKKKCARNLVAVETGEGLLSLSPQALDLNKPLEKVILFFRASHDMNKAELTVSADGNAVFKKIFVYLRPPEMQRVEIDFSKAGISNASSVKAVLKEK